jgi:hypothetical protein
MRGDREHHRVFAACSNEKLAVLETDDGWVGVPRIGSGPDGAVFNSRTQQVLTSNRAYFHADPRTGAQSGGGGAAPIVLSGH